MTLIKSLLLGSAAGIVAVGAAQAADLPTRKAAPVEFVRVCNVGGIVGWTLPGSDTCLKLSGYITAQVVGGNLNTQYSWGTATDAIGALQTLPALRSLPLTQLSLRWQASIIATRSAFWWPLAPLKGIRPSTAPRLAGRPRSVWRSTWPLTRPMAP